MNRQVSFANLFMNGNIPIYGRAHQVSNRPIYEWVMPIHEWVIPIHE